MARAAEGIDALPDTGLAIALGHVVWGDAPDAFHDDLRVHAANLAGQAAVIARYPRPGEDWQQWFPYQESTEAGLAGSPTRIAYIRQGSDGTPYDGTSADEDRTISELWAVSETGKERLDPGCYPMSVDVDDDTIAWTFLNPCDDAHVAIRNLATGEEQRFLSEGGAHEVKLAGRYVTWSEIGWWKTPKTTEVVVYDWVTGTEVYRVDVATLIPPDHPQGYEWHYDLQPDGKLVMAYVRRGFFDPSEVAWFSPAEPFVHKIPVRLQTPYVTAADDLIAGCRRDPYEAAVFDLGGRVVDRLDTTERAGFCRVGFDGERVAWINGARKPALYFDRFPASDPEVSPLVEKPATKPVRPQPAGTVTLQEQDVDCTSFASKACTVETTLRAAGAATVLIGRSNYRVRAGRAEPLRFRLTRAGRRIVKREKRLRSRLSVAVKSPLGDRTRRASRLVLLRPRR